MRRDNEEGWVVRTGPTVELSLCLLNLAVLKIFKLRSLTELIFNQRFVALE